MKLMILSIEKGFLHNNGLSYLVDLDGICVGDYISSISVFLLMNQGVEGGIGMLQ